MAEHEEKHEESLMEKLAEKVHGHDSSSSSSDSDDDKKSESSIKAKVFHLFGRGRPVHHVFGGGKRMLQNPLPSFLKFVHSIFVLLDVWVLNKFLFFSYESELIFF